MATTTEPLKALRSWVEATRGVALPLGPPNATSMARADTILAGLKSNVDEGALLTAIEVAGPDLLYALCSRIAEDPEGIGANTIEVVYRIVRNAKWDSVFDESSDLLARLAFLSWDLSRRADRFVDARAWRARCTQHALDQEHIKAFFASTFEARSTDLNSRFLCDPATVLAFWSSLDSQRNTNPRVVANEAACLADWLERFGSRLAYLPSSSISSRLVPCARCWFRGTCWGCARTGENGLKLRIALVHTRHVQRAPRNCWH